LKPFRLRNGELERLNEANAAALASTMRATRWNFSKVGGARWWSGGQASPPPQDLEGSFAHAITADGKIFGKIDLQFTESGSIPYHFGIGDGMECADCGVVQEALRWSVGKRPVSLAMIVFRSRRVRCLSWWETASADRILENTAKLFRSLIRRHAKAIVET
jgi:hypothetical protein